MNDLIKFIAFHFLNLSSLYCFLNKTYLNIGTVLKFTIYVINRTKSIAQQGKHKLIGATADILGVLFGLLFGIKMAYFKP